MSLDESLRDNKNSAKILIDTIEQLKKILYYTLDKLGLEIDVSKMRRKIHLMMFFDKCKYLLFFLLNRFSNILTKLVRNVKLVLQIIKPIVNFIGYVVGGDECKIMKDFNKYTDLAVDTLEFVDNALALLRDT